MNQRERTIRLSRRALKGSIALLLAGLAGAAAARPLPGLAAAASIDEFGAAAIGQDTTFAPTQRGGVSLNEAVAIAQRRYPGRVVRAETTMRNGRAVHEVRILGEDGRVRTVRVDAASGEVR